MYRILHRPEGLTHSIRHFFHSLKIIEMQIILAYDDAVKLWLKLLRSRNIFQCKMWSLVFQSLRKFPCQLFKIKWNSNSVPHKKFRATALQITYFLWHPVASCVQFIISPAALFISLLAPTNNAACVIYWQILANNPSVV